LFKSQITKLKSQIRLRRTKSQNQNPKPGYPESIGVVNFVGAASSRDRFKSRLACDELSRAEAAPTGVFLS